MGAKVRMQLGKTWVEVECMSVKEAIEEMSDYAEVFTNSQCGICKGEDVLPRHRKVQSSGKTYDFYEMVCLSCGATLTFGQTLADHKLFPRRRDAKGNELGHDGWHQYQATQPDGDF